MLSHRSILADVRRTLKALPEHPHACDVVAAPGSGTRTIVARDSRGRPLLTVSALAAVNALAPFQPEVRARWNAAHPAHRVSVPEAKRWRGRALRSGWKWDTVDAIRAWRRGR